MPRPSIAGWCNDTGLIRTYDAKKDLTAPIRRSSSCAAAGAPECVADLLDDVGFGRRAFDMQASTAELRGNSATGFTPPHALVTNRPRRGRPNWTQPSLRRHGRYHRKSPVHRDAARVLPNTMSPIARTAQRLTPRPVRQVPSPTADQPVRPFDVAQRRRWFRIFWVYRWQRAAVVSSLCGTTWSVHTPEEGCFMADMTDKASAGSDSKHWPRPAVLRVLRPRRHPHAHHVPRDGPTSTGAASMGWDALPETFARQRNSG